MVATLCLFTCALATAQQPTGGAEWQIAPRLSRGEELVYSGSFQEETTGRGVQYSRSQQLDCRVFVLDATPQGTEIALFTIVRERHVRPGLGADAAPPISVRLEAARVNLQGRIFPVAGMAETVPLEGPASIETGAFVEVSRARVGVGQSWEVQEVGRPSRTWKVVGTEAVNGAPCIKLVGIQQSDDWDEPRGDRSAWRRRDTVWLAPNLGIALRFERVIERREPARRDPSQRSVTAYTLDNRMVYPGQLAEDRRREILLVRNLTEKVKPYLKEPEKAGPKYFEEVLAKVAQHMENHPATPYREAVKQFQRRMEAARRGEAVSVAYSEETPTVPPVIALDQPAPDFVVPDLVKRESARLRKFLGQPILMVFYSPTSRNAVEILKFAQSISQAERSHVTVIGLAVSDDADKVLKQRDELRLSFPLLSGQGLRLTYAVDATPKFVVLDASGVVRGAYVGWGRELPGLVTEDLNRWKHSTERPEQTDK